MFRSKHLCCMRPKYHNSRWWSPESYRWWWSLRSRTPGTLTRINWTATPSTWLLVLGATFEGTRCTEYLYFHSYWFQKIIKNLFYGQPVEEKEGASRTTTEASQDTVISVSSILDREYEHHNEFILTIFSPISRNQVIRRWTRSHLQFLIEAGGKTIGFFSFLRRWNPKNITRIE